MVVEKLLTAEEVAHALQVRASTIRLWGRRGWIPVIRLTPKVLRYDLASVVRAMKKRQNVKKASG